MARDQTMRLLVSAEERREIIAAADRAGLSLSSYLRLAALALARAGDKAGGKNGPV